MLLSVISVIMMMSISALDISGMKSRESHYYKIRGVGEQVPISAPVRRLDRVSILQCAMDCFGNTLCWSFFHNYHSTECKQYGFNDFDSKPLKTENGSTAFRKDCAIDEFFLLHDICLRISSADEMKNFQDATLECEKDNAVLISLDTTENFLIVLDFLKAKGYDTPFFVGLSDIETEGTWEWQNSNPANLNMFHPGQTNDYDSYEGYRDVGADCAVINVIKRGFGDNNCQRPLPFICEAV